MADFKLGMTDFKSGMTDFKSGMTDFKLGLTEFKLGLTDFKLGLTDLKLVSYPRVNKVGIIKLGDKNKNKKIKNYRKNFKIISKIPK